MLRVIQEQKAHICSGMVAETETLSSRLQLAEAGFDIVQQAAALDFCGGDSVKALDLLRGGWTPEMRMVRSNSGSSLAPSEVSMPEGPRCPFSGASARSGGAAARCPFSGASSQSHGNASRSTNGIAQQGTASAVDELSEAAQVLSECGCPEDEICQLLGVDAARVRSALAHDRYASAAATLAKQKVPLTTIADKLHMSEARVHSAVQAGRSVGNREVMLGRVLGSSHQQRLDELSNEDAELCCPVSLMLFRDPVVASDGFMYESDSIKAIIRNHQASPMTRERLGDNYFPARQKKSDVTAFREKRSDELLRFAEEVLEIHPQMAATALERVQEYLGVLKFSQVPGLAKRAAEVWEKTGRGLPQELQPYLTTEV